MLLQFDYPRTCENLMNNYFGLDRVPDCAQFPALDIVEQENKIIVAAELPGIKKEDVKITFENNILTLKGEKKPIKISETAHSHLKEISARSFSRSIRFGLDVDTTKLSAEMDNGILTITLPKTEAVKTREISIQ